MCCSVKARQQSLGTFIWSRDISARVNKENVIGLHFYKGAWQIYIKGRMSKVQSDGIIGSRIKTWLPGRQKAMISWIASKVMWEKYVGLAVCWSPETSTVGWISAKENLPAGPLHLPSWKQAKTILRHLARRITAFSLNQLLTLETWKVFQRPLGK